LKNSIGEYSMSTQSDSSPAFSSDVGAAIELADGLAAALGEAAALAGADGDAAAGVDGDAVVAAPLVHADAISPAVATNHNRRLYGPVTVFLLLHRRGASVRSGPDAGSGPPRRKAHLYHL
jgi:hypothetical protein